jgi:hypothetical protein
LNLPTKKRHLELIQRIKPMINNLKNKLLSKFGNLISENLESRLFNQPRFTNIIDTKSLETFDIRKFSQIRVAFEAAGFYNRYLYNAEYHENYCDHLSAMSKQAAALGEGVFLEFGVATGTTIKIIANASGKPVVGFDSFQGLPEDWRYGVKRGAFAGKVPELPLGITLKIGLIENTLPTFLKTMPEKRISFIHIDTDLYAPARLILSLCKPYFHNTMIVFDEFLNYPGWRDHEYKAFREFQSENIDFFDCKFIGLGGTAAVSALVTRKI